MKLDEQELKGEILEVQQLTAVRREKYILLNTRKYNQWQIHLLEQ
jgi:hypothetical protein